MISADWACLRKSGEERQPGATPQPREQDTEEGEAILCRACRHEVTTSAMAVDVDGAHEHVFSNPAGLLFEIGCFDRAPGCVDSVDPTIEFSWFPDFAWCFASCRGCATHLGWLFRGKGGREFWGLILNRLVVP